MAQVLILLDLSYVSRFWTQYEAWLSFQTCDRKGLRPAAESERRCTIWPIVNANETMKGVLEDMWANVGPDDAQLALSKPDVSVTNQRDKTQQLRKLSRLEDRVRTAFANSVVGAENVQA